MNKAEFLSLNSVIPYGKYANISVSELIEKKGKEGIWSLLKEGMNVSDEILSIFNITKHTSEPEIKHYVISPEEKPKSNKVYKKETTSKEKILKEILTLDFDETYKTTKEDIQLEDAVENSNLKSNE